VIVCLLLRDLFANQLGELLLKTPMLENDMMQTTLMQKMEIKMLQDDLVGIA